MENSQREMAERMANLLPENKRQMSLDILPRREPFQILYRLNCDNWCADFHEDLEFRFSWGFMAVIKRFAEKEGQILTAQISNGSQEVRYNSPTMNDISLAPYSDSLHSSRLIDEFQAKMVIDQSLLLLLFGIVWYIFTLNV
jgi:hypothetical protein